MLQSYSTTSSFGDIREGQVFGLVCKKCGKTQYRRFKRKNIAVYNKMLCTNVYVVLIRTSVVLKLKLKNNLNKIQFSLF